MRQTLAGALAGHFHQAQRREAVHGDARVIASQGFFEFFQHGIAMFLGIHVDEIADDDATQIAQAQLTRDDLRRFQIGLENGVVEIAQPDIAAGIHVYGGHRLGLVDDQIAAGLQVDALGQRTLDLFFHAMQIEQWARAGIVLELVARNRIVGLCEFQHPLVSAARIDQDAHGIVADKITQHAQADVEFLIQQLRRTGRFRNGLQIAPQLVQIGDVGGKIRFCRSFRHSAYDIATLVFGRQNSLQAGTQGIALFHGFNALGYADMRLLGQIHQQSSGDAELGGQPRTLAADRLLDDLHHQGLAFEQHLLDRFGCLDVVAVFPYIRHMQKSRAFQADVYESGLHAGQHAFDLAEINVADDAATAAALDVQVLHHAELHHRDAGFLRGDIDQYLFTHGVG